MEKPLREITPIKERIAQFLWDFEGRKIRFGVGGAWVADNWNVDDSGMRMLMRCYEEGFRYFDTSRDYGESERVFGEFIKRIDRKSIFLSTKSYFPFNNKEVADPFQYFKDNFYQSFERLHTDHIDLFLIHDTENIDVCTREVIPFLREQRDKGLIDYIGLGTRSIQAHKEAIAGRGGVEFPL
jgi:aryl-alcohol dehydrogenase-like predicted oxidoreductase